MDILQIVKPKKIFFKASFNKLSFPYKFIILIVVASMLSLMFPVHATSSEFTQPYPLIFVQGDQAEYLSGLFNNSLKQYRITRLETELKKQRTLTGALSVYLRAYNSPLADYADIIVKTDNWKKILALANAESSLCRKYLTHTNNCWGVGGSTLWTMGSNLSEGIVAMDDFLKNHPRSWDTKYADMTFEEMNGLYKQPPGDHWVYNNQSIYEDLTNIENNI
jgi:hypothetical protein